MVILTREQRKKDFYHIMSTLEVDPEDNTHKLLMILTKSANRSIITILNMDKLDLKNLTTKDSYENKLSLDDW